MSSNEVSRRGFVTAAAGSAAVAATAGTAAAAQGEEEEGGDGGGGGGGGNEIPAFGSYVTGANLYEDSAVVDARGQEEVSVSVGAGDQGVAFDPAAIWVSPGTTVTWEWTGEGGGHNVVTNEGPAELNSGSPTDEGGATYSFEFTEEHAGITSYKCEPHESLEMKGGVAVGDGVETKTLESNENQGPAITIPDQALALTLATFIGMGATLGLGYFFMKYGGDYPDEE